MNWKEWTALLYPPECPVCQKLLSDTEDRRRHIHGDCYRKLRRIQRVYLLISMTERELMRIFTVRQSCIFTGTGLNHCMCSNWSRFHSAGESSGREVLIRRHCWRRKSLKGCRCLWIPGDSEEFTVLHPRRNWASMSGVRISSMLLLRMPGICRGSGGSFWSMIYIPPAVRWITVQGRWNRQESRKSGFWHFVQAVFFKEKRRDCVHIATVIQSKTVSYIHFLMEKLLPFDSHKAYNRR